MDYTVDQLKAKLDQNEPILLIDVRESYEHEEFNIGGQLIPVGSIMAAIPDLEDHKEDEIVVYCRSGNRSGMAQHLLQAAGFKKVRNLLGGMLDWQEKF